MWRSVKSVDKLVDLMRLSKIYQSSERMGNDIVKCLANKTVNKTYYLIKHITCHYPQNVIEAFII